MTRENDAFRASFELLSQAPALRQGQELGQTEIQPPVPAATRSVRKNEMKRGSEEGDEDKEAKKPKEEGKAPAPAPKEEEEAEPPVCNVGNLLEICDQDVDFAVELVGEGGQEMTGHAAKAVQQASAMEGGWLTAIKTHAHSIKGVAGNLGMERLRAHAASTESWARTTAAEVDRKPEDGPLALEKSQRLVELVAEVVEWGKSSRATIEAHARANPV